MNFNNEIKEWKLRSKDPLKWWLSKLDENQIGLIDEVKKRMNSRVDCFSEMKKQELEIQLGAHISFNAQKRYLEKQHEQIVNKESYNSHYKKVLISTGNNNYINDEFFNEFIYCFEVVVISSPWVNEIGELRANEYLEDVATINLIERFVEVIDEDEVLGNTRLNKKEIPEWKKVLAKLANRFDTPLKPTAKFTVIYLWMKHQGKLLGGIDDTAFRLEVRENHGEKLKGRLFNNFARIDENKDKYIDNKAELTEIYNS